MGRNPPPPLRSVLRALVGLVSSWYFNIDIINFFVILWMLATIYSLYMMKYIKMKVGIELALS